VDCRLPNAPWKSFGCTVLFSGAREETVVLDTREVVEVDAKDISEGGWAGRWVLVCSSWAKGLENWLLSGAIRRGFIALRHDCVGTAANIFTSTWAEQTRSKNGDHDVG
jgi:hypothetical protein